MRLVDGAARHRGRGSARKVDEGAQPGTGAVAQRAHTHTMHAISSQPRGLAASGSALRGTHLRLRGLLRGPLRTAACLRCTPLCSNAAGKGSILSASKAVEPQRALWLGTDSCKLLPCTRLLAFEPLAPGLRDGASRVLWQPWRDVRVYLGAQRGLHARDQC